MTDPNDRTEPADADDAGGPELTPEQDAAVRRALADAGGPEPMPGEVVARLDAVISSLASERSAAPTPEISHPEDNRVIPIDAAARRRRVRARVLLAAAAVIAVGAIGIGLGTDHDADKTTAADQSTNDDAARGEAGLEAAPKSSSSRGEVAGEGTDSGAVTDNLAVEPKRIVTDEPLRTVRPAFLREDLVALQHITLPHPAAADYTGATLTAPQQYTCEPAAFGLGYLVGVEYDGKPAVVAFREPVGSTQEAEVLACGTGDVLHSTTLAATG